MTIRVWVDDERHSPVEWTGHDVYMATTSIQAINIIRALNESGEEIEEISLDHDLGGDDTGMKVLDWIIEEGIWPNVMTVHTANPPARSRMIQAIHAEAPFGVTIFTRTW
jgi:hypothetical protein